MVVDLLLGTAVGVFRGRYHFDKAASLVQASLEQPPLHHPRYEVSPLARPGDELLFKAYKTAEELGASVKPRDPRCLFS